MLLVFNCLNIPFLIPTASGGTNTAAALQQAESTLFDISKGARPDAKKIVVLVTDGASNSYTSTVTAANSLKVLAMIY